VIIDEGIDGICDPGNKKADEELCHEENYFTHSVKDTEANDVSGDNLETSSSRREIAG